jgi:hypothetical protein
MRYHVVNADDQRESKVGIKDSGMYCIKSKNNKVIITTNDIGGIIDIE